MAEKVANLTGENSDLKAKNKTLSATINMQNTEKDTLKRQVEDFKAELQELMKETKQATDESRAWKDKYNAIEKQLFENRKTFLELQNTVKVLEAIKKEFPAQLKAITDKFNGAQS